jgi:hypothetical protein
MIVNQDCVKGLKRQLRLGLLYLFINAFASICIAFLVYLSPAIKILETA